MPFNPRGGAEVPLEVMGSWVTEMAPIDLPKGVSPDNQEMTFVPGNAGTRPALHSVLASPFPAGGPSTLVPTVVYAKSFVTPTGAIVNFYLDSNGEMWIEDPINSPGSRNFLFQTTPGSFCKSTTAFGREYISISDGLHGQDIPYQYDGTNLDRVTQDGPGAAPTVTSISLPSVGVAIPTIAPVALVSASLQNPSGGIYYNALIIFAATPTGFNVGDSITISGSTSGTINSLVYTIQILSLGGTPNAFCSCYSAVFATGTGGTATDLSTGNSLTRNNNVLAVHTAAAHHLKVGYQALLQGNGSLAIPGGINSIVINNETNPGIALVTTNLPHGLLPQNNVTITGISPAVIGAGGGWTGVRNGESVTLTIGTGVHGLSPGATVQVTDAAADNFQGSFVIASVPSPTQICYYQVAADATAISVTVAITWPIPDNTISPTFFEVLTAPTATTFQVQVSYADGTWGSGTVSFPWDGKFYVTSVPTTTSFTCLQYGPNGTTTETSGNVTPYGQCAPGLHVCQLLWLTRQGAVSRPSPPTTFISNGGQYVSMTNIAIAPSNVVARILAFSGAQPNVPGIQPPMFYLPVPSNVSGLVVSTATQVNDNTTASIVLDFSDNSLFAGIGISVPGNNVRTQIKLEGSLGFGYYDTRLTTWGQRNIVQNLLNMGFGGGNLSGQSLPLGWTIPSTSSGGTYVSRVWDGQWSVTANSAHTPGTDGLIQQSAYLDPYGSPILTGNTAYKVRCQIGSVVGVAANVSFVFFMSSASTGFSSTATIPGSSVTSWEAPIQGWFEAAFTLKTPVMIPQDMIFGFYGLSSSGTITFKTQEWNLIYSATPYLDTIAFGSYGNNPEGIDGLSGKFGAVNDSKKLMDMAFLRDTLYMLTQDPSGRIHETNGSDVTEPNGWVVNETDANCGALSAFTLTKSQADDSSASGGEEWMAWASESGARIFGGGTAHKISQEIQSAWSGLQQVTSWPQVNMNAALTIQAMNDPVERCIYFFLPIGQATAPSQVYPVSYRELDTAENIAAAPPFHPSLMGRLVATDNTRKWTHWLRPLNGAARMYRSAGQLTTVFFGGNGLAPGAAAGYGNVYILNASLKTDADYGQINSWYVTYFFVGHDEEQGLQLGSHRKMLCYLEAAISWTGQLQIIPLLGSMTNPSNLICTRTASNPTPTYDVEWTGGSVTAQRMAFKITTIPQAGQTDNGFSLQKLIATLRMAARLGIRGSV